MLMILKSIGELKEAILRIQCEISFGVEGIFLAVDIFLFCEAKDSFRQRFTLIH